MKSRMGRLKTHIAGDSFVSGSGVLRYWSIALCTASVSSSPSGPVLSVMSRFILFTPISARQLLWGKPPVVHAPSVKEIPGLGGGELWSPVRGRLFLSPVRGKGTA